MFRRFTDLGRISLLLAAALQCATAAAQTLTSVPEDKRSGSALLLERCWTQADLAGRVDEMGVVAVNRWRDVPPPVLPPDATNWLLREPRPPFVSIRNVWPARDDRVLALTFNLIERPGEVGGYDAAVIDLLRRAQVPATFFASGRWMQSHPERTRQLMADPLFELGSLGWDHRNLALADPGEAMQQWLLAQAMYRSLRDDLAQRGCTADAVGHREMARIAEAPTLMRFPYGRCDNADLERVAALGVPVIQWNLVLDDVAQNADADAIVAQAEADLAQVGPGAIVVGHADGRSAVTASVLQQLLQYLNDTGYRLVTVSTLLTHGEPAESSPCYEHQRGDNRIYDDWFPD